MKEFLNINLKGMLIFNTNKNKNSTLKLRIQVITRYQKENKNVSALYKSQNAEVRKPPCVGWYFQHI